MNEEQEQFHKEKNDKYRIIFEGSHEAIMTLEPPSWNFTSANPATIKLFLAKDENDFLSYSPWQLSPEYQPDGKLSKEKAKEMIEKAMCDGCVLFEWTHKRLDGSEFVATVLLSRIEYNKMFLQATVRDITKIKLAEEQQRKNNEEILNKSLSELKLKNADLLTIGAILKDLKEKHEAINEQLSLEVARANAMTMAADQASVAKNTFLANVGHELRSPLNDIVGFSEILLNKSNITPEDQISYIETINKRTQELIILVNDLLDISKIEAGKLSMSYETIKFKNLISEVGDYFAKEIKSKKIKYNVVIEKNVPIYLIVDPFRLKQILTNLVDNAVKFTENGKINLHAMKIINKNLDFVNKVELEICVSDTGIGIPKHNQSELFKPFSQVQDSKQKIYGGTGLGLAISRRLVEMMGGKIHMEDNIPKGSIFCFTIIANIIKDNKIYPMVDDIVLSNKARDILNKRTVNLLVVEDQSTSVDILRVNIQEKNKKIIFTSVADGQKAISIYNQGKVDAILTDIVMPVMDGFDLIQQIRAVEKNTNKHTPIIAMTASASEKDREKCLEAGADFYITKPIIRSDLYKTLDKMIEKYFGEKKTVTTTNN